MLTSFEMFYDQINKHKPADVNEGKTFRAKIISMAHRYTQAKIDRDHSVEVKSFARILKNLKKNNDILITKPDKGSGVVILNKVDYITKMLEIVNDDSKFQHLGPVSTHDKTTKREKDIRDYLQSLVEKKELREGTSTTIKPSGTERPRLYGLPKTHKPGVPLRPILSMIGSPQHKLAKYLNSLLDPVIKRYSRYTIKDSFEFAKVISEASASNTFMVSFDVRSLFTNVPLLETIDICAEALYDNNNNIDLKKDSFKKLIKLATSSVEFSFNEEMYQQKDGVSMGSPLGPTLAGIFMGHLEEKYFEEHHQPLMYHRYVDDCFILFKTKEECQKMFADFNNLHESISFTMESEINNNLPFLDVSITRHGSKFTSSIYRKATFTGQYINFRSHCSLKRKTNLIRTLCDRAIKICSPENLDQELNTISQILQDNSYPKELISKIMEQHRRKQQQQTMIGPQRCPIPIKLQFLGKDSHRFESELKAAVKTCYFSAEPRIIFSSRPILNHCHKDPIPKNNQSMVIYQFKCCCDSSYVGRTKRRFIVRMKEHVPKCVEEFIQGPQVAPYTNNIKLVRAARKSSVAQHLLENKECGKSFDWSSFTILHKCRSLFQLKVMEAITITTLKPVLCKQCEFDFTTVLI